METRELPMKSFNDFKERLIAAVKRYKEKTNKN